MAGIKPGSLLLKITGLITVTVALFALFFWYDLRLTRQSMLALEKAKVVSTVQSHIGTLSDAIFLGFNKPVEEIVRHLVNEPNGIVAVEVRQNGKRLYRYGVVPVTGESGREHFALKKEGHKVGEVEIVYIPLFTDVYFQKYKRVALLGAVALALFMVLAFNYLYRKIAALTRLADRLREIDPMREQKVESEEGYYEIRNITDAVSRLLESISARTNDLKNVNTRLRENERRLVSAQRIAKMSSWTFWPDDGRLSVSGEFYRILEINRKKIKRLRPVYVVHLIHPEDRGNFLRMMEEAIAEGRSFDLLHRVITAKGKIRYIRTEGRVRRSSSRATEVMGVSMDVTEEVVAKRQAEHMAYYDPLTGLLNRRAFMETLQESMEAARIGRQRMGVVFIDLDNFKFVNDSFGHPVGDELLRQVAAILQQAIRKRDVVGRFGGDEFVLLIRHLKDRKELQDISGKLLMSLNRTFEVDNHSFSLSASVGVALFPDDAKDADLLIRYADAAMYEAKKAGKNRHRFFDRMIKERIEEQGLLIEEMRSALKREGEIVLFYQPQVCLRDGTVRGAEVLARWYHPRRGLLYPTSFIPMIESGPLMIEFDDYIMKEAFKTLYTWQLEGKQAWKLGLNLSAGQFNDARLINKLEDFLARYPIDPSRLEIEITESLPMQDIPTAITILRNLKRLGFKIAIDDFGTGYSSLSYLRQLPFDVIKIDREFVREMHSVEDNMTIVKLMIQIAKTLDKEVVAEGADKEEHIRILKALSCDYVQGYYYAKGLEKEAFEAFAARSYESA